MTMTETERLSAINPLSDDAAARLAIDAGEREMLDALVTRGAQPSDAPAPVPADPRRRLRRSRTLIGALAVAIPVIVVLVVALAGHRAGHEPGPAPAHRPTPHPTTPKVTAPRGTTSPQVLWSRPGWHVWYADEEDALDGEADFARDGALIHNGEPVGGGPQLHWYPAGEARGYIADRASEASIKTTMRVLGATAHVIQYKSTPPGHHQYSAIWTLGSRALEFRDTEPDMSAFKVQLSRLRAVDDAAWLRAMPHSVVAPEQRSTAIQTMLRGIPVPPGFNVRQIPGRALARDRYQLGTAVTGVVACEWFARWGNARTAGNQAEVNRAITAMSTAARWPILRTMNSQGGWTQVLVGYAKAMPSGLWAKRPLLGDVDSGLGCSSEWHIKLPGA